MFMTSLFVTGETEGERECQITVSKRHDILS